jgi:uncharacterized protein YcnI
MTPIRILALTLALAASAATPALAHVTVTPTTVTAGSTPTFTFRCPDERASSATIELAIQLPPDVPLRTVRVPARAGWRSSVTTGTGGAPDVVTWTGGRIAPHAVQMFTIVAGPMPAGRRPLPFKAVQTYDDGSVVRWIDERVPGEPEPPYPAPVVDVR